MDIKFKEFVKSNNFKLGIKILGGLLIALLIFQAGIFAGFHRAKYSMRWGDNYNRIVGRGDNFGMMDRARGKEFFNPDGSSGKIVKLNLPSVFVSDNEGIEKELRISSTTIIRKFRDNIKAGDLKIEDFVVSVGKSNEDGSIDAKLIRIMPEATSSFVGGRGMGMMNKFIRTK